MDVGLAPMVETITPAALVINLSVTVQSYWTAIIMKKQMLLQYKHTNIIVTIDIMHDKL